MLASSRDCEPSSIEKPELNPFHKLRLQCAAQVCCVIRIFYIAITIAGMPFQRQRAGEMGGIEQRHGRHYRAHIKYYDDEGARQDICGPLRAERRRVEEDLSAMRAAGVAAAGELAAAAEAARRQAVIAAMTTVANQLKKAVVEERAAQVEEVSAYSVAPLSYSDGAASTDVVMAAAVPYEPRSEDADEPWQLERRRGSREEDAWLNITGATHDKPTFGLDRNARRRLCKDKGFTAPVLTECTKRLHEFIGERASAAQIRELLSILPTGTDHKLGIEMRLLEGDAVESYSLLVDYRKRIADLVSCVKPVPETYDTKRVVLKVIDSIWASDIAAGIKFFECVANRRWNNLFKGLTAGDLFIIAEKGTLKVTAVGEVASAPRTKVAERDILYCMLLPERHAALDEYLADAATFDFVQFKLVYCPPQPLAARDMLRHIGAETSQWQGVVHISVDEVVHTRLRDLIETWPCHVNNM